jgi:DNA replication protein DnaC
MYDISKEAPSVRHRILSAGLPIKSLGKELSDLDNAQAIEKINFWMDTVRSGMVIKSPGSPSSGLGIMLVGEPGHGKTTLASVALQALIRTMPFEVSQPGLFMDYPKFLRYQKDSWKEDGDEKEVLIQRIYGDAKNSIQLFILDDLGKEYTTGSGWAENTFDALLRSRFNTGLPTIVTTNVPMRQWGDKYGEPMGSFAYEAFIQIEVKSSVGDRRK